MMRREGHLQNRLSGQKEARLPFTWPHHGCRLIRSWTIMPFSMGRTIVRSGSTQATFAIEAQGAERPKRVTFCQHAP